MAKEEKILTPEEKERKDRARVRIFIILIIFDILLAGYLIYEMISVFTNSGAHSTTSQIGLAITKLIELFK